MYALLLVLSIFAFGLSIWAQFKVKGNFAKWSKQRARAGKTGAEVAREILDTHGLTDIPVDMVRGRLSDHYDPISRRIRLSEPVYQESSIAAVSVAAHECGHALQHQASYSMLVLRHKLFPIVNLTSGIAPFLLIGGVIFQMLGLLAVGIIFFAASVVFQLVTLPVEFDASRRAKQILVSNHYISSAEAPGVNKVLNAAAWTYVAAALYAVLELVRFVFLFLASSRDD